MKKLLLILILFITSCTYIKVNDNTKVPNRVTEEVKTLKADTLYVVKTVDTHYYYNSDKVLIQKYSVKENTIAVDAVLFVVLMLMLVAFFILFLIFLDEL